MAYWKFRFDRITPAQRDLLESLPGLRVTDRTIAAPSNAAWLAAEMLTAMEIPYVSAPPPAYTPRNARRATPFLHDWVPEFLTDYQRSGVSSILALPGENGHFWWSAGAGKTLGALVWALASGERLTVVVTKAGIRPTWTREIRTYTKDVQWNVIEGTKADRIEPWDRSKPMILVTGYDTLPDWVSAIANLRPTSVIFDEIHKVKSHKRWQANVDLGSETTVEVVNGATDPFTDGPLQITAPIVTPPKVTFDLKDNQTAACYLLSRAAYRRLGTTATPIKDRVHDLWAQLDLIHPWEWGGYWAWAKRYCGAAPGINGGMEDKGNSNLGELKRRLALVGHRVSHSVANRHLPPKRRLVTYLKMHEQVRPEGGIAAEMRAAARSGSTAILEARLMESASRKRKAVLAHARDALEAGQKVVIFTGRRIDCERLRRDAEAWARVDPRWPGAKPAIPGLTLWGGHGGDSPDFREAQRAGYMAAKGPALLIGTGDAWGEGLDLQDTDLAIFAMLPYTPGQIIQWEGRFARLGQKRPVLIRYLICEGSIDEHVATILLEKIPAVERVMESDEVMGLGRELVGASEEELIASLCDKVLRVEAGA